MRKVMLIRWGVVSAIVAVGAGGALAVGCGGSSGGSNNNPTDGGGSDSTNILPGDDGPTESGDDGMSTSPDSSMPPPKSDGGGGSDAGSDADSSSPPPPEHGKLILVHAAGYAPPMRFCFGFVTGNGTRMATVNAAPDTALGLPPGLGGPAADTSTDIASQTIEVFGIVASTIASQTPDAGASELNCQQLIGSLALAPDAGGLSLVQGRDYFDLGQLPSGTIADGTTTLLAVTGCLPGLTGQPAAVSCLPTYDAGAGDLGLWYKTLDRTIVADGGAIGAQFAQLSLPLQTVASAEENTTITATAGFYVTQVIQIDAGTPDASMGDAGDAGDATAPVSDAGPTTMIVQVPATPIVATGAEYGAFTPTTVVNVPGVSFDGTSGFFVNAMMPDGGTAIPVPMPLPTIQALSFPNSDAGAFMNGNNYVFVMLGDPTKPSFIGLDGGQSAADAGGQFNPLSAHILGFPTNPPFGP